MVIYRPNNSTGMPMMHPAMISRRLALATVGSRGAMDLP